MFGILPFPVPVIEVIGDLADWREYGYCEPNHGPCEVFVNGEKLPPMGDDSSRTKYLSEEHGIIVKVDSYGAGGQNQAGMYLGVNPEDQPYFSVPVAVGENWIAEVFYSDMTYFDDATDYEEARRIYDRLTSKYSIVDWATRQVKMVNDGVHLIAHDYADYDASYTYNPVYGGSVYGD